MARRRSLESHATRAERASRPAALRDAELVYMERLFRVSTPVGLMAKLDRAYRLPSGMIVLVEFKTRWSNQPSLSDVIQLSAQRMAVMGRLLSSVSMAMGAPLKSLAPPGLRIGAAISRTQGRGGDPLDQALLSAAGPLPRGG